MIFWSNYWQETVLSRDFRDLIETILEIGALYNTKADCIISIIGKEIEPIGTPRLHHPIKPASSPYHPIVSIGGTFRIGSGTRRIGSPPASAPFPGISVNIVKSPYIRFFLSNRMGGVFGIILIPTVISEFVNIISEKKPGRTAGPSSIFPFSLSGQTI